MSNLTLSKKEVAERQLNTAIRLFFQSEDPASIHSLTSAAHEIFEVLTRKTRDFNILIEASLIKPEKKKEVIEILRNAQNFFKHANRDASTTIEFSPFHTEVMLYDTVLMCIHLTGEKTPEVYIFEIWFLMKYPQYFNYLYDPKNPLFELYASMACAGINPENLKSFSDSIPVLQKSGKFPIKRP